MASSTACWGIVGIHQLQYFEPNIIILHEVIFSGKSIAQLDSAKSLAKS